MADMKKLLKAYKSYIKPIRNEIDHINDILASGYYQKDARNMLIKRKNKLIYKMNAEKFIQENECQLIYN